jgi:hypothetical protein
MKKTHRKMASIKGGIIILVFLLVAGIGLMGSGAHANQVFSSDCAFGFQNFYGSDEIVCVSGDVDTKPPGLFVLFPEGDVYVTNNRSWSFGDGLNDVTLGGFNTVVGSSLGGAFFDIPVWLPPLTPGRYDLILDENQDGTYNSGDTGDGLGSAWAFQVGAPIGVDLSAEVAAIKASAGSAADFYESMELRWKLISDSSAALSIGFAIASGDMVSAAVGAVSLGLAQFGIDFPTDYNAGVMAVGGKVLSGIAGQQGRQYRTLANDPPDPNFTEFILLDMSDFNADLALDTNYPGIIPGPYSTYPYQMRGSSAYEQAQVDLKNNLAVQSELVDSLTRTFEKLQGAENAGDDTYIYLQARALKKYTDMLVQNLDDTRQSFLDYKAQQTLMGLDAEVYLASDIQIIRDRLVNSGFTADEISMLKNAGFIDAAITDMLNVWTGLTVPGVASFTRGGTIDEAVAEIDAARPDFVSLSAQAQSLVNNLENFVFLTHPTADAGGPYAGDEGTPVALDGSASSDPNNEILTFEWDLDLDGNFDDASGSLTSHTFDNEFEGMIGLRVTNISGNSDTDYTPVSVVSVNDPPEITSFSPAAFELAAASFSPLDFSATATDPDFDPITFSWTEDDVEVSTASAFTYTPSFGPGNTRVVKLTVSDSNPLSLDASELRVVRILECLDGNTQTCGIDTGECQSGIQTCANGVWGECIGEIVPVDEICDDGLDNDCDGKTDNDDTSCIPFNLYDINRDWIIGNFELLDAIDQWAIGNLGNFPLLDLIDYWAAGCYQWDAVTNSHIAGCL